MGKQAAELFSQLVQDHGGIEEIDADTMLAMACSCHLFANLNIPLHPVMLAQFCFDMAFPLADAVKAAANDQWDNMIPLPIGIVDSDGNTEVTVRKMVEANHVQGLVPIQKAFQESMDNYSGYNPFNLFLGDSDENLLGSDDNDLDPFDDLEEWLD